MFIILCFIVGKWWQSFIHAIVVNLWKSNAGSLMTPSYTGPSMLNVISLSHLCSTTFALCFIGWSLLKERLHLKRDENHSCEDPAAWGFEQVRVQWHSYIAEIMTKSTSEHTVTHRANHIYNSCSHLLSPLSWSKVSKFEMVWILNSFSFKQFFSFWLIKAAWNHELPRPQFTETPSSLR